MESLRSNNGLGYFICQPGLGAELRGFASWLAISEAGTLPKWGEGSGLLFGFISILWPLFFCLSSDQVVTISPRGEINQWVTR